MARSIGGLDEAGEWPAFRALLPSLGDKKVLDLGCGFGWHCRYVREQQAHWVLGVDLFHYFLPSSNISARLLQKNIVSLVGSPFSLISWAEVSPGSDKICRL